MVLFYLEYTTSPYSPIHCPRLTKAINLLLSLRPPGKNLTLKNIDICQDVLYLIRYPRLLFDEAFRGLPAFEPVQGRAVPLVFLLEFRDLGPQILDLRGGGHGLERQSIFQYLMDWTWEFE